MEKPNNIVKIPTSIKDFFRYWFMFLEPFHNLTNRELDVITAIVRNRYELSKVVKDNIISIKNMIDKRLKNNDKKLEEENMLLGKNITVIYSSVKNI